MCYRVETGQLLAAAAAAAMVPLAAPITRLLDPLHSSNWNYIFDSPKKMSLILSNVRRRT